MIDSRRFSIKIGGWSGQGINSMGEILAKSLKNVGYNIFAYREYPSLIQGGFASYKIDFSTQTINSSKSKSNLLVCIGRTAIHEYLKGLEPNGVLIHSIADVRFSTHEKEFIGNNNIQVHYVNADQQSLLLGGRPIMSNVILLGLVWKLIGLELGDIEAVVLKKFASKPEFVQINKLCLSSGYDISLEDLTSIETIAQPPVRRDESLVITGNDAISLGAISAGVRAYYSYPMTPASSILTYLANVEKNTGMLVKQVEDEITAVQMTLGSMYMGTRSFTGTSGGGFDLMTETISLSGMTETPFVCVLAQRPGPATGLPTWTAAGDLNLAVYSGHGEFPRCVVSVSDVESSYLLIQQAFNLAEEFQIPVILLTEKQIAESLFNVEDLPETIEIRRGLLADDSDLPKSTDRYQFTESGVSDRWIPGSYEATYNSNSDEHTMDGSGTEDSEPTIAMMAKRMRKLITLKDALPEPVLYGDDSADITIVGWGSVKNVVLDAMKSLENESSISISYLHYEYMFPLKTDKILSISKNSKKLVLIENNYFGQLGNLIKQESGIEFDEKLLKYDGRPFFLEEVTNFIKDLR